MPLIQLNKASTVVPSWSVPGQIRDAATLPSAAAGVYVPLRAQAGPGGGAALYVPPILPSRPGWGSPPQPTFSGLETPEPLKYTKLGGP